MSEDKGDEHRDASHAKAEKAEAITPASAGFGHLLLKREGEPVSYKSRRPKRRRKGQLNDGEWADGYGPDAKAKREGAGE